MKNFIWVLFFVSTAAFALPAPFNEIAVGLAENGDFKKLLETNSFDSVSFSSVPRSKMDASKCGPAIDSRSGTLVEVALSNTWKKTKSTHYFVTSHKPADLTLCK